MPNKQEIELLEALELAPVIASYLLGMFLINQVLEENFNPKKKEKNKTNGNGKKGK
ncbi:MAG: hypothetical protein QXI16_03480 [Sulfolobaceae archaeon]